MLQKSKDLERVHVCICVIVCMFVRVCMPVNMSAYESVHVCAHVRVCRGVIRFALLSIQADSSSHTDILPLAEK